jgi:minimal CRISPR polymerase domain
MGLEWFLALDGDDIGRRLELYMLTNDADSLTAFGAAFNSAITSLVKSASDVEGVELMLFGGDSVMLRVPDGVLEIVLEIVRDITSENEFTFSGGYATTMRGAYLALKLAKSSGKDRIVGPAAGVCS